MRMLTSDENALVAGGRLDEVTVPGRRMGPSDPLRSAFLNEIGAYDNTHSALVAVEDGRPGDARQNDSSEMEEVLVEVEKILADNLKVDLSKCGIPLHLLLNPLDKIDSGDYWKKCFETLTPEDRKNLAEAFKDLNKLISDKKLATSVTGNWIKHCIIALESNNGGWFGWNYFDALKSAKIGPVIAVGMRLVTGR